MVRTSILPAIIRAEQVTDFRATTRLMDLNTVQVITMTVPDVQVSRPWKLVRQSDPEHCHLVLPLRGGLGFVRDDRCTELEVGDLMFYDSSHAFHGWSSNPDDPTGSTQVQVQFPRALLPEPTLVDKLIGVRLPSGDDMRSLVSGYLRTLTTPSATYRETDSGALATITMDFVAALLAHELNAPDSLPPDTRQRTLLARIQDFVNHHLSDPHLSPDAIAAAHHISTRYLHKLFHAEGETVAGLIRRRRLAHCHRDLTDPRLRARPINAIAARWGFIDSAHFSRLFRSTCGISASDYRRMHEQSTGRSSSSST